MAKRRVKLAFIGNRKARRAAFTKSVEGLRNYTYKLTKSCDTSACFIIHNRVDNEFVVWPSPEEANALIDKFYSLSEYKREMKAVDSESVIKSNIQKAEKKLAKYRKVSVEFEMEHLMFELQHGRELADLSRTEVDNLMSYSEQKIMCSREKLARFMHQLHTSTVKETTPRDSNVASSSGWVENIGFNALGSGTGSSTYHLDQWFSDDREVQKHCGRETHGFDLNLEPSDDDEDMETYKGESSKAAGGT